MESGWLRASLALLLRRPRPPKPSGGFGALEDSLIKNVVIFSALLTVFEVPFLHWLVSRWWPGHGWIHAVVLISHVLVLLWLAGDLRLMQSSWHRVDAEGLWVHLGDRWRGRVPLEMIAAARCEAPQDESPFEPAPRGVAKISPLEPPNVVVALTGAVSLRNRGREVEVNALWLRVDAPEDFVGAIGTAKGAL